MQPHHQVQHTDHHHGHEKEADGGDLHDHVVDPDGLQHSADGWLLHPLGQVEDAMQGRVGDSTDHWHDPDDGDHPFGVLVGWQVPGFKGVKHGDVPLDAQSGDVEDGGEANGFKEEGLEVAAALPKREGVVLPQFVNLQGHPKQKHKEVWQSQAQKIKVGGVSHFLVPCYHRARQQIPRQAHEEDEEVNAGHREEKGGLLGTEDVHQVDFCAVGEHRVHAGVWWQTAILEAFGHVWKGIQQKQLRLHFMGQGSKRSAFHRHRGPAVEKSKKQIWGICREMKRRCCRTQVNNTGSNQKMAAEVTFSTGACPLAPVVYQERFKGS